MSICDERVIQLLSEEGVVVKDVASAVGVAPNTVSNWKSGIVKSYTKCLPSIAEYFGVSSDWLSGVDGSEKYRVKKSESSEISLNFWTFLDRYVFLCKSSGIEPCSEAAAKKIGVSTAAISGWNKKRIVPRGANLQKVADAFSVF